MPDSFLKKIFQNYFFEVLIFPMLKLFVFCFIKKADEQGSTILLSTYIRHTTQNGLIKWTKILTLEITIFGLKKSRPLFTIIFKPKIVVSRVKILVYLFYPFQVVCLLSMHTYILWVQSTCIGTCRCVQRSLLSSPAPSISSKKSQLSSSTQCAIFNLQQISSATQ